MSLKGRKFSEEHKKKLSLIAQERKYTKKTRKKMSESKKRAGIKPPSRLGIKHTKETRKKLSDNHKGENGFHWKGGITPKNTLIRNSIEFRLWRESVFARDNWTCQKCKERGVKLHAHHILNFSEYPALRFAIDNGITLCKKCHLKFHNRYGRKNNTKEQINYWNQQK